MTVVATVSLTMHWPQVTYALLLCLGIGISLAKHGEPKTGTHNAVGTVLATAVIAWLLYQGGFWTQP